MKFTEALVLAMSLLAVLFFAADMLTWPVDPRQMGATGVRDYSCSVVQDQIVCDRDRVLIGLRGVTGVLAAMR